MSSEAAVIDRHHNQPPLEERLRIEFADVTERREQILEAGRALVAEVTGDDVLELYTPIMKDGQAFLKGAEAKREGAKRPHLDAGRTVDGHFKSETAPIEKMLAVLNKRVTVYLRAKADDERRQRVEEARLAQVARDQAMQEAATLDAANRRDEASKVLDEAHQLDIDARVATKAAEAKPSELARTHTIAATATLRTVWTFEILDRQRISPSQLWPYFTAAEIEKAVTAAVRNGVRSLEGIRIFEDSVAQTR